MSTCPSHTRELWQSVTTKGYTVTSPYRNSAELCDESPVEPHLSPLLPDRLSQAVAPLQSRRGFLQLLILLSHHFFLKRFNFHLQSLLWPFSPSWKRRGGRWGLIHSVTHTERLAGGGHMRWRGHRHIWIDFSSLPPISPPFLASFAVILAFSRWLALSLSITPCFPPLPLSLFVFVLTLLSNYSFHLSFSVYP